MIALRRARLELGVAALTLLGLALRLFAARGALWLDEAWSATFAQEAATPLGVIWRINHDNNHILNTLWLQLVGPDAPPLAQRALSIAAGTAAIPLAAAFGARRGQAAGLFAALAFAISPILVTYGSEARGYAAMVAAALAVLVLVDGWIEHDAAIPAPAVGLSVAALIGTLAQVMMVAPLLATAGWAGVVMWRRHGFARAVRMTLTALGPALAASGLVLLVMALAARASPHGFTIGSYYPFHASDWIGGIARAIGWTVAISPSTASAAIFGAAIAVVLLAARRSDPRALLYAVLVLAFPLAFALFRVGNVATPRFYLAAMMALLLLAADGLGRMIGGRGGWRLAALTLVALFTLGAARLDLRLIGDRRADPAAAIAAIRAAAPGGARLMLPDQRLVPVFEWGARSAGYPLRITGTSCTPAAFLMLDDDHPAAHPETLSLCCGVYRRIAAREVRGLSGTNWWLYRRIAR